MKQNLKVTLAILILFSSRVVFAEEVIGRIEKIDRHNHILYVSQANHPHTSQESSRTLSVTANENTSYKQVKSFESLRIGESVQLKTYGDELTGKNLALEIARPPVKPQIDSKKSRRNS